MWARHWTTQEEIYVQSEHRRDWRFPNPVITLPRNRSLGLLCLFLADGCDRDVTYPRRPTIRATSIKRDQEFNATKYPANECPLWTSLPFLKRQGFNVRVFAQVGFVIIIYMFIRVKYSSGIGIIRLKIFSNMSLFPTTGDWRPIVLWHTLVGYLNAGN